MTPRPLRIYIAASWTLKEDTHNIAKQLTATEGFKITSKWFTKDLPNTQEYWVQEARADFREIRGSDVLVLWDEEPSTSGGMHVEFGIALADGLDIIVVGPRQTTNPFHYLPRVKRVNTWGEVAVLLNKIASRKTSGGTTVCAMRVVERK